jgi:Effector protein
LAEIPVGRNLLDAIVARIVFTGGRVRVSILDWDGQTTNKCATVGNMDDAKSPLALSVEMNRANMHNDLSAALNASGHVAGYAWLAAQMNAHFIPNIMGPPAATASSAVHGPNWITAAMTQNWATVANSFPAPLGGQAAVDAQLIIVCVLAASLGAEPGIHARVHWRAASRSYTNTLGAVITRPPFISLGHELVHAYHNIMGNQTGHDIGTPTRVLYEWLCVGLGPWAAEPLSENTIRASANMVQRDCY